MSHPRRHAYYLRFLALGAALLALASVASLLQLRHGRTVRISEKRGPGVYRPVDWRVPSIDVGFESLFSPLGDVLLPQARGGMAARYRLVGVLLNAAESGKSTAFIEEKATGRQRRLRVGEALEPRVTVKSIAKAEVWVLGPDGEECLVREGRQPSGPSPSGAPSAAVDEERDVGLLKRFGGVQTGTNSWAFSRASVLDYYQELMDRPERLVKVFDSLAPVYDDERKIEGYRVGIEGEADFFAAVGLRQGDIVRSVNSIAMTNRRRAENLIRRFTQNDLDLVIIELDRDGRRIKQFYETK